MADSRCISVVVADGDYLALRKFGFPLPALASMQEAGVHLRDACWDIKKSLMGVSVSFFWPATTSVGAAQARATKNKR